MKIQLRHISKYLILSAAIITSVYLLMLGYYNVLSLDDYGCVADVDHTSVFGYVQNMYMTWQGRWSAFFVDAIYYKIWGHASDLVTFTLFQLTIGYVTVYVLLKKLFSLQHNVVVASVSVLFVNLSIFALQEISTFYWLCCPHYILCVWAFIWLYYLLFLVEYPKWWHSVCIIFISLYLSGIAETITPLVIMILGFKWLYNIVIAKRYNMFRYTQDRYLTYSLIVLCAGLLVMVLAPGNATRINQMSSNSMIGNFVLSTFCIKWCKATIILGLRFISKSLYYISITIIAAWMGYALRNNSKLADIALDWRKAIYVTLALVAFFAISVAPCVYAMGWYAPPRSFSYMSFVFAFYAVWTGFSIGYNTKRPIIVESIAIIVALLLSICSIVWIIREQPALSAYNAWVKTCQAEISQKVQNGDDTPYVIQNQSYFAELNTYAKMRTVLNKLRGSSKKCIEYQYPYMLFEVDEDPTDWKNQGLNQYYNANFEIIAYEEQ